MFLNYENNIHYEVLIPNLNNIINDYNNTYTNNNLQESNIDKNLKNPRQTTDYMIMQKKCFFNLSI